ncbi:MAG: hypothetical protein WC819_01520 [Parcubacteria group bacterium]|jgi:hypothetical protein
MAKCPCGCGGEIGDFGTLDDLLDTVSNVFGSGDSRARKASALDQIKKIFGKLPKNIREQVLRDLPKEVRDALGVKEVFKPAELVIAERKISGMEVEIAGLRTDIDLYCTQADDLREEIKKLKKTNKKLSATKDDQAEKISQMQIDLDMAHAEIKHLHAVRREDANISDVRERALESFTNSLDARNRELVTLTPVIAREKNLREIIDAIDLGVGKAALLVEINKLKSLIADVAKGNGGDASVEPSDGASAETKVDVSTQENVPGSAGEEEVKKGSLPV